MTELVLCSLMVRYFNLDFKLNYCIVMVQTEAMHRQGIQDQFNLI